MRLIRRLRPRVYVTDIGGGMTSLSIYPDQPRLLDQESATCANCGTGPLDGWLSFEGEDFCSACDEELHGEVYKRNVEEWNRAHPIRRFLPVDRLRWWYALTFGKRVRRRLEEPGGDA